MKKLLTLLLTLLMVFTLVGCNSKEDTPVVEEPIKQEEVVEEAKEESEVVGGYVDVEDGTITPELNGIFATAMQGLIGASYNPIELVATQVVSGTNYKFLAEGSKTTNPITKGTYYITIYEDLQGNISLSDIEVIEEKQEEIDLTTYDYWVVFYNPDGNELQRTAEKYGSTPKYVGDTPIYWDSSYWYKFIGWTDKKGNEIKEFKPITGNTYIYAKYEIGGENKPAPSDASPTVTHICNHTSNYLLNIDRIEDGKVYYYVYSLRNDGAYTKESDECLDPPLPESQFSGVSAGQWVHTDNGNKDNPIVYVLCEDIEAHNLNHTASCLAGNTLITMANGEKKRVEELKTGDEIVAFDHDTGKKTTSYVIDFFKYDKPRSGVFTLCFDNNIDVTVVDGHSFYEKDCNKYVTIYKNDAHNYLGKLFYDVDEGKWVKLNKIKYSNEKVETYIVITDKTLNFSANGILSVEDDIYTLIANIFEFDSNLKIDAVKKEADLNKWGYWSFDNLEYMNKEGYDALNLKYLNVAIGKGMITQEEILAEEAYAATFESDYID